MSAIIQLVPGSRVWQAPRQAVVYSLTASDQTADEPTVKALIPAAMDGSSLTVRTRHALLKNGPVVYVEVTGGIAGTTYEIRWSPLVAFEVRVTGTPQAKKAVH